MNEKLKALYDFLLENRTYNFELQKNFCQTMIGKSENRTDRLTSLLYRIVNTQSQPRIDPLSDFFKLIFNKNTDASSLKKFIKLLNGNKYNFEGLYESLKNVNGWGPKTAALFTKNVYLIHNIYKDNSLKFWDDVPNKIQKEEKFYVPVDTVILAIFRELDGQTRWTFDRVNTKLNENYQGDNMEVWDDLWFWGFFNQRVIENNRAFEWNESKYWILNETNKSEKTIKEIKEKSAEFLKIIER